MAKLLVIVDLNDTVARKAWNADFTVVTWTAHPDLATLFELVRSGHIDLMLWSGAWRATVDKFVAQCVPADVPLFAAWCRDEALVDDECPDWRAGADPTLPKRNIAVIKDLALVFAKYPQYGEHNTLIVDDSAVKTRRYPRNALIVPKNDEATIKRIVDVIQHHMVNGKDAPHIHNTLRSVAVNTPKRE